MKNLLNYSFLALIAISSFSACTKKSGARTTSAHYLTVTISSGGGFTATDSSLKAWKDAAYLGISGITATGAMIELGIMPNRGTTGTWYLRYPTLPIDTAMAYYTPTPGTAIEAVHGNITFTAASPNLIGTFNFTGTDSIVYTGSFNVATP